MALALSSRLEALLFASGEPLTKKRLAAFLDTNQDGIEDALNALRITLEDRGLMLVEAGETVEMRTSPEAADTIQKLRESELSRDLGKASLETLAIILYKGGSTRGEIDWVRGVNSGAAIRALLLRGLIERTEDKDDKRRAFYKPTVDALAHLGAGKLEDLPRYAELHEALAANEATASDV
ncbi:MAG: SMC-Scp complex subunit ScpB [Patescibacteria group bacterium]